MSFHLKDDFKAGAPISQVPAGWFNAVAKFLNGLVGGFGIKTKKSDSGRSTVSLDRQTLQQEIDNITEGLRISKEAGTPGSVGSSATNEVTQSSSTLWKAGGANGAKLLLFYKSETKSDIDKHDLFAAELTITSDGLIRQIDAKTNSGIKFPRETAPTVLKTIQQNSGYKYGPVDSSHPNPTASSNVMKTDTWTRGNVDGNNKRQGVKIPVFTRCVDGNGIYYFMFRELTFDSLGRLTNVSKELGSYNVEGF